ncbi:MAG: cytochrome [Cereibacter sphaeroides]|uniref:Cytochrome n=1 Tax=Cereibacter sphaeroides TaxID=1063 RepID=A0A2W5SFC3_CERSP|nr:MAG: cytochrome [Cereibacter sphaeroides]
MALHNTNEAYGSVARTFHWLTALLILTAIPLGLIASRMPYDTAEQLASKAQLFSVHKTIGVAAFLIALSRILWTLFERHLAHLHPERRLETVLAALVHWALYISMLMVPLTGWIGHAATTGFAPILWPFGQGLPFVPQSPRFALVFETLHWAFTKILIASVILHVLGAIKHAVVDRDDTMARMTTGRVSPLAPARKPGRGPMLVAVLIYIAGAGLAWSVIPPAEESAPALEAVASDWKVTEGTLAIGVKQMGQDVGGSFADWTAAISFDETPVGGKNGRVTVTIATDSLTLGSVTSQAKGDGFFDTKNHPTATFEADILPDGATYRAEGTLTLRGTAVPVTLPFTLALDDNRATMHGETTLDRRAFGIGAAFPDEQSVGFPVTVTVDLTAERQE